MYGNASHSSVATSEFSPNIDESFWLIHPSSWPKLLPDCDGDDLLVVVFPCQLGGALPASSSTAQSPPTLRAATKPIQQFQQLSMVAPQQQVYVAAAYPHYGYFQLGYQPRTVYYMQPPIPPPTTFVPPPADDGYCDDECGEEQQTFSPPPPPPCVVYVRKQFFQHLLETCGSEGGVRMTWQELQVRAARFIVHPAAFFRDGLRFGYFYEL